MFAACGSSNFMCILYSTSIEYRYRVSLCTFPPPATLNVNWQVFKYQGKKENAAAAAAGAR